MRLTIVLSIVTILTVSFIRPHKNLRSDANPIDTLNSPKVLLFFIVEKNGTLSNIKGKIVRCNGCDKTYTKQLLDSAILMLKKTPKWNVGMRNGRTVRVSCTLPVVVEPDTSLLQEIQY